MALALDGFGSIDADTHLTEAARPVDQPGAGQVQGPRAPRRGDRRAARRGSSTARELGFAGGGGVIDRDGEQGPGPRGALRVGASTEIHLGAYDPKARLEVMDDSGI